MGNYSEKRKIPHPFDVALDSVRSSNHARATSTYLLSEGLVEAPFLGLEPRLVQRENTPVEVGLLSPASRAATCICAGGEEEEGAASET